MNNDTPCGDIADRFPCKRCGAKAPIECPDFNRNRPSSNNNTPADAITQADRLERFVRGHKGIWLDSKEVGEIASLLRHRTTSLAAQDGLVEALRDVLKWLKDPQMRTWTYIEGNYFYRDVDAHAKAIEAALASIEVKSS